jgi:site-specific DNA-cytosine methylase
LGLRDSRTKLLEEAIRVIHLINDAWPDRPCGYLFENVDAVDHPQEDVRDEFNTVVKRVLGPGFAFDAVAVGSSAHRHRRWWTNLAPHLLLLEMVENKFKLRNPDQHVQKHVEPGRQAQNARHSAAPGRYSVNVPGQPLRAFATFVTVKGSHAFRPGQQSMVQDTHTSLWDEPSALERERAMGFMDNTTCAPSITEADRRQLLGSTMDMHALTFLVGSVMCFQHAFFSD